MIEGNLKMLEDGLNEICELEKQKVDITNKLKVIDNYLCKNISNDSDLCIRKHLIKALKVQYDSELKQIDYKIQMTSIYFN